MAQILIDFYVVKFFETMHFKKNKKKIFSTSVGPLCIADVLLAELMYNITNHLKKATKL